MKTPRQGEKARQQIEEAFTVGAGLLIGRATCKLAANTDKPRGRPYFEAFGKWKKAFGYVSTGDMSTAYFDDCLVIAEHREIAEQIIAEAPEDERFGFGVSTLAKRTRWRVRLEFEKAERAAAEAAEGDSAAELRDARKAWLVDPSEDTTRDPAFVLRREEFEQWLVRRREALEFSYLAREAERAKGFEAKVKARVEAETAKHDARRVFTPSQFMSIWRVLHPDAARARATRP